ncbi:MAG: imidazole glycerol phosphate synthase subunit HisF [Flavobacteriales bacterium]|nr:MAG: imidazole glycerol phosphate synthase subunit HisF [Flavobacteriales bacterium]
MRQMIPRVIPVLLLKNAGLVKTVKFKEPKYVGDPLNAVKIFNEKEVDELVFLDITATVKNMPPPLKLLSEIASECFMPFCYGGAIRTIEDIKQITNSGVEKVSINNYAVENPDFIEKAATIFGSSTIVISIDVKKNFWGKYEVYTKGGKNNTKLDPVKFAVEMNKRGAGEILLNSIDRDGTQAGFDIELVKKVSCEVDVPVIACGGSGSVEHLAEAIKDGGASAVAAGSQFVFHGKHRAVLINYPSQQELKAAFS